MYIYCHIHPPLLLLGLVNTLSHSPALTLVSSGVGRPYYEYQIVWFGYSAVMFKQSPVTLIILWGCTVLDMPESKEMTEQIG